MEKKTKTISVWKLLMKLFLWLLGIVIVVVVGLVLTAEYAHDKIVKLALPSVQKAINAPVDIKKTSLSFIRAFPYTTLELNDVYLGSVFETNTIADSLVFVEKLYVSLKSEPLMNGLVEITAVEFKGATIKYLVAEDGSTSYDFLMSTDTTTTVEEPDTLPLGYVIDLQKLTISDITCYYEDKQMGAKAKAYIPKITAKGALSDSLIQAQIKGNIQVTNVYFDSTNVHKLGMAELKLNVDYKGEDVLMREVSLALDDIIIDVKGSAKLSDSIYADINLNCDKIDVADVVKFAPDGMLSEFGVNNIGGLLNFAASVKGNVTDSIRYPHVEATLGFKNGYVETVDYPRIKNIGLNVDVTTGNLDTDESIALSLKNLHFETAQSSGTFNVKASNLNVPRYDVAGQLKINISEFTKFIPSDLGISQIVGMANVNLKTKGVFTGNVDDAFIDKALRNTSANLLLNDFNIVMDSVISIDTMNFNLAYNNYNINIDNTNVSLPDFGVSLKNVGLALAINGGISDFSKTGVDISKFHVEIADSKVDLEAKVTNLDMPTYEANLGVDVNIDNFKNFFPDSLAYSITGGVLANVKSHGTVNLDSIETQVFDIVLNNTEIGVKLNNITADMYDSFISFSNLGGDINIGSDTINVDKLNVDWQGLKLHVDSTKVANALKIFMLEQTDNKLSVLTKVSMDDFDYAWVEQMFPTDSTIADSALAITTTDTLSVATADSVTIETDAPYSFLDLGYPVEVKGMFKLGHLQYEKASIDNISAKFNVNDTVIVIDQLKLDAFNGNMLASARVKFKSEELMQVFFRAGLNQMDLNKLLVDFDNFDQTDITSDNLTGIMTANFDGYSEVINMGDSIPMEKIRMLGNLKLENGSIVNLEMLKELDRYVNMRELNNIQFQTLETSVFIRNNNIYLPQTDIKSTAMNVSAFGMQSFADDFEYHIKIFPGEIMLGNSKKVMKKQSQMDDNLANESNLKSINLLAYQIGDESKYWFDTDARKKKMRTRVKVQQKQLELVFNPRLTKYETGVNFK